MKLGRVPSSDIVYALRQILQALDNGLTVSENFTSSDQEFKSALTATKLSAGNASWQSGAGTPEGAVTASPGSLYSDTTNGEVYVKNTGSGNTGWKIITHA